MIIENKVLCDTCGKFIEMVTEPLTVKHTAYYCSSECFDKMGKLLGMKKIERLNQIKERCNKTSKLIPQEVNAKLDPSGEHSVLVTPNLSNIAPSVPLSFFCVTKEHGDFLMKAEDDIRWLVDKLERVMDVAGIKPEELDRF